MSANATIPTPADFLNAYGTRVHAALPLKRARDIVSSALIPTIGLELGQDASGLAEGITLNINSAPVLGGCTISNRSHEFKWLLRVLAAE